MALTIGITRSLDQGTRSDPKNRASMDEVTAWHDHLERKNFFDHKLLVASAISIKFQGSINAKDGVVLCDMGRERLAVLIDAFREKGVDRGRLASKDFQTIKCLRNVFATVVDDKNKGVEGQSSGLLTDVLQRLYDDKEEEHACEYCETKGRFVGLSCSNCKDAWYCSMLHQRKDWKTLHKPLCATLAAEAAAQPAQPVPQGERRRRQLSRMSWRNASSPQCRSRS